ncbi:PaaI family thioesterase [Rhizobium puerariae]|uniref:PaaI family thioesterase n=1 Tax=Rhizobium puerariae TaxID=1585791 RepID=A0ABV6APJ7_9HYPH
MTQEQWIEEEDSGFIAHVGPILQTPTEPGQGRFRFIAEDKHRNRAGYVQGGMLMTFADRAMGKTARQEDPDRAQATAQFDMQFLAPVEIGTTVDILCKVVKSTRHLVFMRGELFVENTCVATAQGVWKIIDRQ